LNLQQW